ncbi:MAG: ornithine cyclodeaminase family protein, partial [Chloroflexota bacterium]|nr:ornithine cyclodeaminase family protein [Chloroflexota bacterium]
MLLLDNDDVAKALTIDDCLEVLEASLRDYGLGQVANRPRSHCYAPLGQDKWYLFKTMDAIVPRYDVGGVRLTSEILSQPIINDKKRRVMLPGPSGRWVELILLFRMSTSEPLAIVPGGYLQRMRVGSTAAISAKYLSRQDAQVAALIGTGGIGAPQLEAIVKSLKLDEIRVFSATPQRLSEFVTHWRERVQVPIRQATSTKEAVDGADIVSCATNSFAPVFDGNWLQPGVHVNSVQRGELDDVTIARADV